MSLNAQAGERFFQQGGIDTEPAAAGFDVLEFVEGAKKTQLDGGILFGVVQRPAVSLGPRREWALGQKDAYRVRELAVRGDVENEFRRRSFGFIRKSGAFSNEIVLIHVTLGTGVGFEATNGHGSIMDSYWKRREELLIDDCRLLIEK